MDETNPSTKTAQRLDEMPAETQAAIRKLFDAWDTIDERKRRATMSNDEWSKKLLEAGGMKIE
jgi:hypothetical protein